MSKFQVDLHQYFGPLDLLLHIVRREELALSDLPLAKITNQYFEYLEVLVELSIDDVADFIEIASILFEMKAKQAVPDQSDPADASLRDRAGDERAGARKHGGGGGALHRHSHLQDGQRAGRLPLR